MAFIDPNYDSSDQFNPYDFAKNITQNDIDFLCKTYQTWHDFFFGSDNDDSSLAQVTPFTFTGMCCIDSSNIAFGGRTVNIAGYAQLRAHLIYSFSFDGYNANFGAPQPVYADWIGQQSDPVNQEKVVEYMSYCNTTASGTQLMCSRKGSETSQFYSDRCINGFTAGGQYSNCMPCSYQALATHAIPLYSNNALKPLFRLFNNTLIWGNVNSNALQTYTTDTVCIDFNTVGYIDNYATANNWYKNFGTGLAYSNSETYAIRQFTGRGSIVTNFDTDNMSNDYINNVENNTEYNNTFNYTTNQGDTITVRYGDDYIFTGDGGKPISYDELVIILNDVIDDLNINGNLTDNEGQPLVLTVPTFEEIKYSDRGTMHLDKWQMYPENIAPHVVSKDTLFGDLTPNGGVMPEWVSTVGTTVSVGVNGFLSLFPDWIGILIGVCFVTAFLVRNMRKGG